MIPTATRTATLLLLLLVPSPALAANAVFQPDTARTLPAGHWELGVFAPLRWGVTDRVTLSTHPLLDAVAPQLDATVGWGDPGAFEVASQHGLLYPTLAMRLLSREGTGGIVPHDVSYPHILATSHHLLVSREVAGHLLTLRAGGRLAWNLTRFDGPRFWSQVEWHFIWPRAAAWFTGWSLDAGLAAEGPLWRTLGYRLELDGFLMPGLKGDRAAEWAVIATWRARPGFQLRGGLKWSWCEFPSGTRTSVPFPLLDAVWTW